MRIRKRYPSPLPPPDLFSPPPPSMSAAAVAAPPVAAAGGATGDKEGEAMVAAAAAATRVSGSRYGGGGGGRGLHPNGRPTNPTPCPPFDTPPSGAAAERGDLPAGGSPLPTTRDVLFYHGHGRQVPKQDQDGEMDGGDAHGCGGNDPAPKSLGAKASLVPVGHGGHKVPPRAAAAALAAAEVMVRWSDGEGKRPPNKRGGYLAARGRSWGLDEEEKDEENMVAEREMEQRRPSNSRRRRTAASSTPTMAAPAGTVLTSAGSIGNIGGAPTATGDGDGAGAPRKCDDVVVKEEGGDVVPAMAATLADGNRRSGNGKKRRSPAVLMEGSRCSRVNGRGWRCCQQTLVGYSLCEHHLGKGRLRSVSSVRCNGRPRKKQDVDGAALPPAPSLLQKQDQPLSGDGEDEEEEMPGERKRNKIGMVKARSISSLLHQPAHSTAATIAAPEPFTSPSPTPATCPVTAAAPPPYGTDTAVA